MILLLLALLGNLHILNRQLTSLYKLTAQGTNLLRGEVCVNLMNFACRHRLNGQNLQQVRLDRLVFQLGLAGLGTARLVAGVQLCQLSSEMLNHLIGDFAIDYSVVSLTISNNFRLSYGG